MKLFSGSVLSLLAIWVMTPSVWFSTEMQARVVTPGGVPVAGAIVVANWNITGPWNGASLGQLEIAETVTDKDGQFRIPAWGPRFLSKGVIMIDQPTVRIFKPGFIPVIVDNYEGVPMKAAEHNMVFRRQNQSIELTPFKGGLIEYESTLIEFDRSLGIIYDGADGCYWKKTPRLLLSLQDLKMKLVDQGRGESLPFAYQHASINQPQCGDAKQFFTDYK